MEILKNFVDFIFSKRSYGIGMLEDNVEETRDGISQTAIEERRKFSRVEVSVPVWYLIKGGWTRWLLGKTINYSRTGVRLALSSGVTPGTEISIRMKLPDAANPINLKGVVIWVKPSAGDRSTVECGVAFQDIRDIPHKEKLIYLIANKLCKIGLSFTKNLIVSPVSSVEDLKSCFGIVYRGYIARRYCLPNYKMMHYNYYSFLPESRTFTLKQKDKLIGTISLIVDSPCALPMDSLFQREIDHLRGQGRKLAEVSLLAMASDENRNNIFSLTDIDKQVRLFLLFKIMYEYAVKAAGVTDLIIGVHPKHETLYKYFFFKAMGSPKKYPGAHGNPALPMHLDLLWAEANWNIGMKTFFLSEQTPLDVLYGGLKVNTQIAKKFLCEELDLWSTIPPKGRKFLKECYPGIEPPLESSFFKFFKN